MSAGVALVVGAGDATGGAVARRFAKEGLTACVARRNGDKLAPLVEEIEAAGGRAVAFACDARRESEVIDMIDKIEADIGTIEAAVHNIGANVKFDITDTTERVYRKVWEMAALSAFLMGREVARVMTPRGRGTIIFTGATASIRGGAGFAAFAGAKHAKRALAQSMARELGPKGIHVAHSIIDGPIDTAFIQQNFADLVNSRPDDGILSPDDIAANYIHLHKQPRSAWTHELDMRPWLESW